MNPNNQETSAPASLLNAAELLAQIGEELAFVAPEQDAGLLPINRFVMDLEEISEGNVSTAWAGGLKAARGWLDDVLDGRGKFTEENIRHFNEWHAYMSSILEAGPNGERMPAWPAAWDSHPAALDGTSTAPTPEASAAPTVDEPTIRLNLAEDLELLREFHSESVELLQSIEQGVLVLEANPTDVATINSIFRAFHTFKGGAGFLHLDALRDLAHELESLLDAVRRSELRITSEIINLILAGADALKEFTNAIGSQLQGVNPGAAILVSTRQVIRNAKSVLRGEPISPVGTAPPQPTPATVPSPPESDRQPVSLDSGAVMAANENRPVAMAAANTTPPKPIRKAQGTMSANESPSERNVGDPGAGFVKLDTAKLDSLVDLVGELVIAQSMVVQNPDVQNINSLQLARNLRQLSRITTDLQRNAMSLRMVPIRGLFNKMSRLVRDLATQQQKQMQLVFDGEETELDRNIVEKLGDPLIHMIRNSVDHGIESPADRIAHGKSPQGSIRLSASHQRGGIVIRITDDGKGLNRDRILAKALERGLVKADAELSESEIFSLIFLPGFSTAETVTDLSGRGVGMDVVRRNIENLRGKIEIQSVLGQGTTFTILLPLTLAIIDGMLVGVGTDRYIIPTLSIRESFRPRPGMVTLIQGRGEVVSVRGRQTPLLRLGHHLGRPSKAMNPEDGIIVVVESGDAARGLLVDELIGKQEVVIKSLGQTFQHQNLLAGSAVLSDGWVGLILDVDTLVKMPSHQKPHSTSNANANL